MAMACSITFNSLQQNHFFFPLTLCKCNLSKLHYSSHFFVFSPSKHTLQLSPFLLLRQNFSHVASKLSTTDHKQFSETRNPRISKETSSGFAPSRPTDEKMGKNSGKKNFSSVVEEQDENRFTIGKNTRKNLEFRKRKEMGNGNLSVKSRDKKVVKSWRSTGKLVVDKRRDEKTKDGSGEKGGEEKKEKGSKKSRVDSPEVQLRVGLDMCSKRGDVMSAIQFYDLAQREGIRLGQYHYTVLLYLCSSAAVGVVRPAKSGSGSRTLNALESSNDSRLDDVDDTFNEKEKLNWFSNGFVKKNSRLLDGLSHPKKGDDESLQVKDGSQNQEDREILVDEDMKKYALQRGFEIYEKMCVDKIPMNEAALTSVARMAMSMGNGDMAFDMVKQMKTMGINPRLRSYGPALSAFCNSGDIGKAFAVEKHMLEHGVCPEEPELEALLRVSVGSGKGDKVYYLLHKLRTTVRKVSPSVADLIANWFDSKAASRVGKTKWDERVIKDAVVNGGGGWHGQGWLGRGKWSVLHTTIGGDGLCQCCGEKLATIDLDPTETENFAESVASIAIKREKHSNFQKFQKWLDYYGPFEAVVDAANVGLFSQKRFQPSKVSAIVNGIRQKLPTKKWPLIVLHNKRVMGPKMDEPVNRALVDKWRNADALYATPTGSNDDWYWLYAAIKFKCLLVTNDEMRDHTFQLLGNDFFPKWKERHQVRFNFSDVGPVFHMPPPCSVVIQESEKGHWHIPILSENDYEVERSWLCIMREKYRVTRQISETRPADLQRHHHNKRIARSAIQTEVKSEPYNNSKHKDTTPHPQEIYKNLKDILSETMNSNHSSIQQQIESAEKLGGCTIDFQI